MKKRGRESLSPDRKAKTNSTSAGSPHRGLICSAFLVVLVGAVQICAPLISSWQSPIGRMFSPVLMFYGDPVMLEFIFGILAYYLSTLIFVPSCQFPNALLLIIVLFYTPVRKLFYGIDKMFPYFLKKC